jgi:hypothetical protein
MLPLSASMHLFPVEEVRTDSCVELATIIPLLAL